MLPVSRHEQIVRRVRSSGVVSVSSLAADLGVSASTIRRDLQVLNAHGALRRIRGGAGSVQVEEVPFAEVAAVAPDEKEAVARCAAEMVSDGEVLLLDIGTTTARLARHLRGRRVTVITSSLAVVDELRDDEAVELLVLGGILRRNYLSMVGMLTEDALRQLRAHRLFLGTSGIRPDGQIMDTTLVEVPVKKAMIAAAEQTVVVADRGKFPGSGLLPVCGPEEVDVIITNDDVDSATLAVFAQADTKVIQA
ncbi:transcriptional regulator, DeoR family [Micromonospora rhizosphaerae]|uniref:Transcriptional regulator, DeoR family n=1 Tax=Micromonospora rhizosphaerae TaxID=568872 RepID=A0A1C6SYY5_9ACTN|nr:DeoR/GlpR family DNA-binding transcription regulator [Micromonospora rhizosphaerae]SCL34786.1 transcriptional regulator, DeoR family [Micromonospora rhizosphaerae]